MVFKMKQHTNDLLILGIRPNIQIICLNTYIRAFLTKIDFLPREVKSLLVVSGVYSLCCCFILHIFIYNGKSIIMISKAIIKHIELSGESWRSL
jgi:hypothetical protein